jgi:hypothetical protein
LAAIIGALATIIGALATIVGTLTTIIGTLATIVGTLTTIIGTLATVIWTLTTIIGTLVTVTLSRIICEVSTAAIANVYKLAINAIDVSAGQKVHGDVTFIALTGLPILELHARRFEIALPERLAIDDFKPGTVVP